VEGTTTQEITAQECFNESAKALREDNPNMLLAMSWKDLGDGLVRLAAIKEVK
jgi:uncharacterized membrane protein